MDPDTVQITDVLIRYATGIDSKDWALFRTCWADEVDVDYADVGTFTDPDVFTELMQQLHGSMGPTYHRLSNVVIAVDGDRATARSYVHAVLLLTPDDPDNWIDVIGHYDDVFVRTSAGWRIYARSTHMARMLTGGPQAGAAAAAGSGAG